MQSNSKTLKNISDLYLYLPQCSIDTAGKFKYIYVAAYLKTEKAKKTYSSSDTLIFVRGAQQYSFHADIFDAFKATLKSLELEYEYTVQDSEAEKTFKKSLFSQLKLEVYGGGWIEWVNNKKLNVFGESMRYGPANHQNTKDVILKNMNADGKLEVNFDENML